MQPCGRSILLWTPWSFPSPDTGSGRLGYKGVHDVNLVIDNRYSSWFHDTGSLNLGFRPNNFQAQGWWLFIQDSKCKYKDFEHLRQDSHIVGKVKICVDIPQRETDMATMLWLLYRSSRSSMVFDGTLQFFLSSSHSDSLLFTESKAGQKSTHAMVDGWLNSRIVCKIIPSVAMRYDQWKVNPLCSLWRSCWRCYLILARRTWEYTLPNRKEGDASIVAALISAIFGL